MPYATMYAHQLPNDTIAITNTQDKVPVMRDLNLPLHLVDWYGTMFVCEKGTFAHASIAVPTRAYLDNLAQLAQAYHNSTPQDQEYFGTVHSQEHKGTCVCERCQELAQFA